MQAALPKPVANADSRIYWDAARQRRLVIRKCNACGERHFMPRYLCPSCWSDQLEWIDAAGTGRVHSFSVIHRASDPAFASRVPYVIALIELDEGSRMLGNIPGQDALAVAVGDPVKLTFEDRGDGALIPQFERITGHGA